MLKQSITNSRYKNVGGKRQSDLAESALSKNARSAVALVSCKSGGGSLSLPPPLDWRIRVYDLRPE
jgi:hypothetical protein